MTRFTLALCAGLMACTSKAPDTYPVRGVVVDVNTVEQVVIDHEAIDGFMDAMVMPFSVSDPAMLQGLRAGDIVEGTLKVDGVKSALTTLEVVGYEPPPQLQQGPEVLKAGEVLPAVSVPLHTGDAWTIGAGQGTPTVVTFLYTTCPIPEFCPAVVARLQQLQAELTPGEARILAVTIDPKGDTLAALAAYADTVTADPAKWRFGRLEGDAMQDLAGRAALAMLPENGEVVHGLRLWVLDADGKLIERYDDNFWPQERVLQQLRTGAPMAPAGSDGTVNRAHPE